MRRIVLMLALSLTLGIGAEVIGVQTLYAQQGPDPRLADLVTTYYSAALLSIFPANKLSDLPSSVCSCRPSPELKAVVRRAFIEP